MGRSWATFGANGLPRISSKSLVTSLHSCGLIFDWHRTRGVSLRERKVNLVGHLCIFVAFLNSMQTPRLLLPALHIDKAESYHRLQYRRRRELARAFACVVVLLPPMQWHVYVGGVRMI